MEKAVFMDKLFPICSWHEECLKRVTSKDWISKTGGDTYLFSVGHLLSHRTCSSPRVQEEKKDLNNDRLRGHQDSREVALCPSFSVARIIKFPMCGANPRKGLSHSVSMRADYSKREPLQQEE